jgi:hypothetical protein
MNGGDVRVKGFALVLLGVVLLAAGPSACRPARIDTSTVEQTFQGADAAINGDVTQAVNALKTGNFDAAIAPLKRVIQSGGLNDQQKEAVAGLLTSMQTAITRSPRKYTIDLYNSVSDLTAYLDGREPAVK